MIFDFLIEKHLNNKTFVLISGLHGDEPAGDSVSEYFKNKKNIYVISNLNPTNKRRLNGKDLNRHFDTDDKNDLQDSILAKIEELNPDLVISLHEDDEVDGLYAYCSPEINELVKKALSESNFEIAKIAHNDETDGGVIVNGEQPYKGTLERALKRRDMLFCTIETPSKEDFQKRVECMKKIVSFIIEQPL